MPHRGVRAFAALGLALVIVAAGYAVYRRDHAPLGIHLAPHRALYQLEMSSVRDATSIANVFGEMFYEFHETCENWTVNQKFQMNFIYPEGDPLALRSIYSTVESKNGRNFTFLTRRERNGQLSEEIRGQARQKNDRPGTVAFSVPQETTLDFAAPAKFPSSHTIALLQAAMRGDQFFEAPLFDGSEVANPVDVTAIIAKARNYAPQVKGQPNALLASPVHLVRMAFFPGAKLEESNDEDARPSAKNPDLPDYEMTLWIHENGVVSQYRIDYPEFSLSATLEALEPLAGECP